MSEFEDLSNDLHYLKDRFITVIDSTIHATQKPSKNQHLSYSDHYKRHGMMTTLLVDFDGFIIISVSTGGVARLHDSMSSTFMPDFRRIVGEKNFALGDPGYAGVDYVSLDLNRINLLILNAEHSMLFQEPSKL